MAELNLYDCPSCGTKGVLPTSDNKCPHCRNPLAVRPQAVRSPPASNTVTSPPPDRQTLTLICEKCFQPFNAPTGIDGNVRICSTCQEKARVALFSTKKDEPEIAMNWLRIDHSSPPGPSQDEVMNPAMRVRQKQRQPLVSRFRRKSMGKTTVSSDCVLQTIVCEEVASVGKELAEKIKERLEQEECIESIVTEANFDNWGIKCTITEGFIKEETISGGQGACSMTFSAMLFLGDNEGEKISVPAQSTGSDLAAARAQNIQTISKTVAKTIIQKLGFYQYPREEVDDLATGTCVLAALSAIPYVGFVTYVIALIMGLMTLSRNAGRSEKIGLTRVIIALIAGAIVCLVWAIYLFSGNY
jgi:hypothetical protein